MRDRSKTRQFRQGELKDQSDWNQAWARVGFLQIFNPYSYRLIKIWPSTRRLASLFKCYLTSEHKVLEIGCAPGRWLIYISHCFGSQVYGVDYSESGCRLTEKALERENITGEVICIDVFDASFQRKYKGYFDSVISFGFIEHFVDPLPSIEAHLNLLKEGGYLFLQMPNYGDRTFQRWLAKRTDLEQHIMKTHNVKLMKIPVFKQALTKLEDLEILKLGYIGPIDITMVTNAASVIKLSWVRVGLIAFNFLLGYLTFFVDSEILSPHLVLIAMKLKQGTSTHKSNVR